MTKRKFYYECPDCGFIIEEEQTYENDTTEHDCIEMRKDE